MNKFFYFKLAWINIQKNRQAYVPYMLTCVCTMVMFYIMHALSLNTGLDGARGSTSLKTILYLGMIVIGIFSAIFLFYTNSFLIKRRKKELGLYNVLGLEKKHISYVLCYEAVITSIVSLIIGILSGIILNKLMFMILLKLLHFDIPYAFEFTMDSVRITSFVFISIFIVNLVTNLVQLKCSNPIELLKGGQVGATEPKSKWLRAISGVLSLGIGYYLALSVESPLMALYTFFIAVCFVIAGTYELFTASSIVILKLLRKNKKFYYKSRNFISISGMIYRMKQNAVGLANICILSTAVIVMLSTTLSLYVGMEDALRYRYPNDISIGTDNVSEEDRQFIMSVVEEQMVNHQLDVVEKIDYYNKAIAAIKNNDVIHSGNDMLYDPNTIMLGFVPLADYNKMENDNMVLADDEVLLFSTSKNYGKNQINIDGQLYKIKEELEEVSFAKKYNYDIMTTYILVVNDFEAFGETDFSYQIGINVTNSDEEIIRFVNDLNAQFGETDLEVYLTSISNNREEFIVLYGGLFFLGLFLGTLFLMATVLIIYYKQISEGYDDKERFDIMQRVGMSKEEVRKTIRKQVLMVFFLPLLFAIIHISFAFPIITKLLAMLNLMNTPLFLMATISTIIIFGIVYGIIFMLTARTYYKIVERD